MAAKRSGPGKPERMPGLPEAVPSKRPTSRNPLAVWAFSLADSDGPWAWKKISAEDLKKAVAKFASFETMPLTDLGRGGSHGVPINELSGKASARLGKIMLEDCEKLYSLRLNGKKRIWCIRQKGPVGNQILYQILWWDPKHEVYPSEQKHT